MNVVFRWFMQMNENKYVTECIWLQSLYAVHFFFFLTVGFFFFSMVVVIISMYPILRAKHNNNKYGFKAVNTHTTSHYQHSRLFFSFFTALLYFELLSMQHDNVCIGIWKKKINHVFSAPFSMMNEFSRHSHQFAINLYVTFSHTRSFMFCIIHTI